MTDAVQDKSRIGQRKAAIVLLLLLICGFGVTLLVFYPGYLTIDARYVYADVKAWHFGDWQSPAMVALWRMIDPLAPGSASVFLLTATLYWLAFGVLAFIALRSSAWLALATPLLALTPPAFFFVGVIWRDVLLGVTWLLAAVLALAASGRGPSLRIPLQVLALLLIAFGVLLRPNAVIAAPLLAIYAIWPSSFLLKRAAIAFLPLAAVFIVLVPFIYYGVFAAERQNVAHSILVFDLGGITHFTAANQFPVEWRADETELLKSKCYDPTQWDSYWTRQPCSFVMQRLERPDDVIFGRPRLVRAWWDAVTAHPLAYLEHRATFMGQFLVRSNLVLPVADWTDAGASYGNSPYRKPLLRLHQMLQPTLLFRPGLWLLLALTTGALSWRRRETPGGTFAVAVSACAAVYVLSFFVIGIGADFRYAYWCVLGTLAALVAMVGCRCFDGFRPAAPASIHPTILQ
jgi:hypothetical protein